MTTQEKPALGGQGESPQYGDEKHHHSIEPEQPSHAMFRNSTKSDDDPSGLENGTPADFSEETTEAGNEDDSGPDCTSFEVSWDGEKDPMNPRNMSVFHKWVIVTIVCTSSLCV
jgi:hypothetical protein